MRSISRRLRWIIRAAVTAAVLASAAAPAQDREAAWEVAVTIDDIPMAGLFCNPADAAVVNRKMLDTLAQYKVQATAFFTPGSPCGGTAQTTPAALGALWRAAGHTIGNHSFGHPDYNRTAIVDYLAHAQRGHEALEPTLVRTRQRGRWYRPPYLHAGADPARLRSLLHWMGRRGYRMGVVTLDNQEWVYARAYDQALAKGDPARAGAIATAYLEHMQASAAYYRALSRTLYDRDIPQVLLIHVNRLNADRLGDLLATYARSGARFISMERATADPVYGQPETYVGERGLSWLQRWALARGIQPQPEPREAEWVARAAEGR